MSTRLRLPSRTSRQGIGTLFFSAALLGPIGLCPPVYAQTMVPGQHITQSGPGLHGSPGPIFNSPPITQQPPRQIIQQPPIRTYIPPMQGNPPVQGYQPGQGFQPPSQIFRQGNPERNGQPEQVDPYNFQRQGISPNQINRQNRDNRDDNRPPTSIQAFGDTFTRRGTSPGTLTGSNPNGIIVRGQRNPDPVRHFNGLPYTLNGYASTPVSTPTGQRSIPDRHYHDNYFYPSDTTTTIVLGDGQVALLGGYYYSNYCDTYYGPGTYPSIYDAYSGFPEYIYNPSVVVVSDPYYPVYDTSYQPFYTPVYQVTYNQTNYYVASPQRVDQFEQGGTEAKTALKYAFPEGSYQAAFGDIALAWKDGSVAPLRKHIRDNDTKIGVSLKGKYSYSIASSDYVQITRDALDRLQTDSFEFTRIRKAKNGDITAYGKHVYHTGDGTALPTSTSDGKTDDATTDNTVPFDQTSPYNKSDDPGAGDQKTVYVSYTLRHSGDQWYIIGIDSSTQPLVK